MELPLPFCCRTAFLFLCAKTFGLLIVLGECGFIISDHGERLANYSSDQPFIVAVLVHTRLVLLHPPVQELLALCHHFLALMTVNIKLILTVPVLIIQLIQPLSCCPYRYWLLLKRNTVVSKFCLDILWLDIVSKIIGAKVILFPSHFLEVQLDVKCEVFIIKEESMWHPKFVDRELLGDDDCMNPVADMLSTVSVMALGLRNYSWHFFPCIGVVQVEIEQERALHTKQSISEQKQVSFQLCLIF